mmetsp:Transcript_21576/g.15773  ORF Transcript_21576/g.15773 Transcript_21576/m.15773 type:complete len:220 (-) Transcript_21576:3555-4214(-)
MFPSRGRVLHHSDDSLVEVRVLRVKEYRFRPHLESFALFCELGDLDLGAVGADVVHESVRGVLGVENTQFSEDALVRSFHVHALLQQRNHLLRVPKSLILSQQFFEVVWLDDDLEAAEGGSFEFLGSHAGKAHFFPHFHGVCLLGCFECLLVLLQFHQCRGNLSIVACLLVQDQSSFEQLLIEAPVSALQRVCLCRLRDKRLQLWQIPGSALGVGEDKF